MYVEVFQKRGQIELGSRFYVPFFYGLDWAGVTICYEGSGVVDRRSLVVGGNRS